MRSELNHIEKIERYLSNLMAPNEKREFDNELAKSDSLSGEVLFHRQLVDEIKFLAFKEEVLAGHNLYAKNLGRSKKGWLFSASIFAVLICVIYAFWPAEKDKAIDEVVPVMLQENAQLIDTSDSTPPTALVSEAEIAHQQGDLQEKTSVKRNKFDQLQQPFERVLINAESGGHFKMKDSQSEVVFPANCFVDSDGNAIRGMVEIRYREFRNPAEMAFSQIPMFYYENGEELAFNSAGMFEVRGFVNNEPVQMKPGESFLVNYNVVAPLDSCYFFKFDESDSLWDKKNLIDFGLAQGSSVDIVKENTLAEMPLGSGVLQGKILVNDSEELVGDAQIQVFERSQYIEGPNMSPLHNLQPRNGMYYMDGLTAGAYTLVASRSGCLPVIVDSVVIYERGTSQVDFTLLTNERVKNNERKNKRMPKSLQTSGVRYPTSSSYIIQEPQLRNNANARVLSFTVDENPIGGQNNLREKNISNTIASGLVAEGFGIYNCDQVNRIENKIDVNPYFQTAAGVLLVGHVFATLIDYSINAAFDFHNSSIRMNRSGRNALLVLVDKKILYMISSDDLAKLRIQESGDYIIPLQEITDQVNSPSDLAVQLGL